MKRVLIVMAYSVLANYAFPQKMLNDSSKLNYKKLYAYCLDGNITSALELLSSYNQQQFADEDIKFRT